MREIEALDAAGERTAAAALWLDLRLLIERADEPDAHGIIRNWLSDKLVMWLMEDSNSVRLRFKDERNRAMAEDFMLEMTEQVRAKLAGHAMRVLESAPSQPENIGRSERYPRYVPPVEVEHALMIRNFLDAVNRKMVSGRIAAIMTEHIRFVKNQKRTINRLLPEMNEMVVVLMSVWGDLEDGMHELIKRMLFEQVVSGKDARNYHALGIAYYLLQIIDENSEYPQLSGAERLAAQIVSGSHADWVRRTWWGLVRVREIHPITPEDVEDFMDAFLKAAHSDKKTFQMNPQPHGLWFDKDGLRIAMRFSAWTDLYENEERARNLIRLSLIQLRVIGYEHLPEDWPQFFHAVGRVYKYDRGFPDEPYWAPLIATPSGTQAMLDHFDVPNDYVLLGLIGFLEKYPPKHGIKEVIVKHFEARLSSGVRSQRITAYRVLLKISHWLEADERFDFRRRLLGFFRMDRPTLDEWCHTMMLPMNPQHDYPRQYAISNDQCRSEWIGWQDDELSAALSWSSQIHHELSMLPHDWRLYPDRSLFMYLNTYLDACDACPWTGLECEPAGLDVALSKRFRRGQPPDAPFETTPWQRARELHIRNPSLDFPDRTLFRPNTHDKGTGH